jgi:hypothetical protein
MLKNISHFYFIEKMNLEKIEKITKVKKYILTKIVRFLQKGNIEESHKLLKEKKRQIKGDIRALECTMDSALVKNWRNMEKIQFKNSYKIEMPYNYF